MNKYPWESLDTFTLMLPEELLTYYLKKYEEDVKDKRESEANKDLILINEYMEKLGLTKEDENVLKNSWYRYNT